MLSPVLITPPATQPVTLADAKAHLSVDHTDHDARITALIEAATADLDGYTGTLGRAIVTQTWREDFPAFRARIPLSLPPVASITGITYFDGANVSQTLASSVYGFFKDDAGPFVGLKPDQVWPGTKSRRDAVSVTYVAGVADTAVPAPIKQAILLEVEILYDRPSGEDFEALVRARDSLLRPYRLVGV